jgi:hypothetical protein
VPASAYALLVTFVLVSILSGIVAARVVGPWTWWATVLPGVAAFGLLYLVGHRWAVSIGPEMTLWGWQVALPFDVGVALAAAFVTAAIQRGAVTLFQA